jgi:PAS domain S-box-containing protein
MESTERKKTKHGNSSAWLEATLDSIADAVIATDDKRVVKCMNPVAERLTGWTVDQASGKPLDEVLVVCSHATRGRIECPVERSMREGRQVKNALPADAVLIRPDGTETPIDDSVALIREHGKLAGAVVVFRDDTARRREMDRLAFLANASVELNASLDYETTLCTVAKLAVPTFADFCQVVMVVDGGPRPLACAHADPEKAQMALENFEPCPLKRKLGATHVIQTGEPEIVSNVSPAMIDRATSDERRREWLDHLGLASYIGVPLKRGQETIGAITLMMADSGRHHDGRDLSVAIALAERASIAVENARLFDELRLARAEAVAANRAKDEFLAVLGHELRNPLAPMVTALELMKQRGHDSRERVLVERQVEHLRRLVDDLLDISRITSSKATLVKVPLDVVEIVANAVDIARPLLEQRRHGLMVTVDPAAQVEGDAVRLVQVVSNLLNNAAKYSAPGAPVWIEAHREGSEVVLKVRDNGIGIDPNVLPRIFDPFVQQPQALDRAQGGLGLGLAIVRGLVHLHGGSVSANSDGPGRGSEFVVRLPAFDCDGPPRATGGPARFAAPAARGTRILVVDDNEDGLDLLVESLRELGYEAFGAHDGAEALALAPRVQPVVALLDIGLPEMDGYELAGRLRELDGMSHIKLVAVSGYASESDRARSAAAGFDEHLAKPVTIDSIRAVVERLTRNAPSGTGQASGDHGTSLASGSCR